MAEPLNIAEKAASLGISRASIILGKAKSLFGHFIDVIKGFFGVANTAIDTMQLISFVQFIQEEAYQTAMFGLWPLLDAGEYEEAWAQLEFMERLIDDFDKFNASLGQINLFGSHSYNLYVQAARRYIEATRRVVKKKLLYKGYKFALEEAKRAYVFIDSMPDRAKIYIDDEYIHHLTPEDWTIDAGLHRIVVSKSKFEPLVIEYKFEAGRRYEVFADFDKKKIILKQLPDLIMPEIKIKDLEYQSAPQGWQPPPAEISQTTLPAPEIKAPGELPEFVPAEEEKPKEEIVKEEKVLKTEEEIKKEAEIKGKAAEFTYRLIPKNWEVKRITRIENVHGNVYSWTAELITDTGATTGRDYIGVIS